MSLCNQKTTKLFRFFYLPMFKPFKNKAVLRALESSKLQQEAQNFDNSLCIFHSYSNNITFFIFSNCCQPPKVQNRVGFIVRKIYRSQNMNHPVEEVCIFILIGGLYVFTFFATNFSWNSKYVILSVEKLLEHLTAQK